MPIAARDGDVLRRDGPIRFGLVGGLASAGPSLDDDLRAGDLAFVVLAGDAVRRGTRRAYAALAERLGDLPAVPMPGRGEVRGDRDLSRYANAWGGLGVRGIDRDPVPWRAFDLCVGAAPWRLVVLDADEQRLGARFTDETYWLPKVLGGDDDGPVLLLMSRPVGSLWSGWDREGSRGAAMLHGLVLRHTSPGRLPLVAAFGTPSPELALPGGPWGEGWLGIGQVEGASGEVARTASSLALEPGFDRALVRWFSGFGADAATLEAAPGYGSDRTPLSGWWLLEVDGARLDATLRMRAPTGRWGEVYRVRWTPDDGWREP